MKITEIIAHRGASKDAPENTMSAFNLAWEQDADAIECDIRLSRDGSIVVIHDENTKRVSGKDALVADQTLEELQRLDVGAWKGKVWSGEKIPTLAELLASIPPKKKLYIEIKCAREIIDEFTKVINSITTIAPKQIVILCFDPEVVSMLRTELPMLQAFLLDNPHHYIQENGILDSGKLIANAEICNAHGLALKACEDLTADLVSDIRNVGLGLMAWVVDEEALAQRIRGVGVDVIATNQPKYLRETCERFNI